MAEKEIHGEISEFGHAIGLLIRRLRASNDATDLSWTQTAVIARLDKQGPATTADLARAEGVKPQSMGAIVSALEELGLVERQPHPTDGRQQNIQLTPNGIAQRRSAREARWAWLAQAMEQLDEQDRKTLLAAGEIIKRLVEP